VRTFCEIFGACPTLLGGEFFKATGIQVEAEHRTGSHRHTEAFPSVLFW
jgi:hypothetical protein